MFDSFFNGSLAETLSIPNATILLVSALCLGMLLSTIYITTRKKDGYQPSFPFTLVLLPGVITVIFLMVNNSVARAFSLAGAFSLTRFRSSMNDTRDIAYIFMTVSIGLTVGIGYVGYACLFTIILGLLSLALSAMSYGEPKQKTLLLKIVVPEDLNFPQLFTDLLDLYTESWSTYRIKTSDLGSMFIISYKIVLKKNTNLKSFLDQLRQRNGNLDISLSEFQLIE